MEDDNIEEQFNQINDCLTLFKMQLSSLQKIVKSVEKEVKKEISKKPKENKEKKQRKPSGFAKPTRVSKELCEFMNIPEGSEIARTEVNKALSRYIKENELIKSKNQIVPDDKLIKLLDIEKDAITELTYFNIQKHMNKHFIYNTKITNK
jgi:chromatin remodeling complex protein RSC6